MVKKSIFLQTEASNPQYLRPQFLVAMPKTLAPILAAFCAVRVFSQISGEIN
jgi:hypothetical protein